MSKMQSFMDTFSQFRHKPDLEELSQLLAPYSQLEPFEKAQILTLLPGDADEAKLLIPSMAEKITDDDLNEVLQDIHAVRRR